MEFAGGDVEHEIPQTVEAWTDAFEEHRSDLMAIAVGAVGNQATGEDLVQSALASAWKGAKNFDGRASVKTWLISILKNKIRDFFRSKGRKPLLLLGDLESEDDNSGGFQDSLASNDRDPAEVEFAQEVGDLLDHALGQLSDNQRTCLTLKEIGGWSTEQICSELGITPSQLASRLASARRNLKRNLRINPELAKILSECGIV